MRDMLQMGWIEDKITSLLPPLKNYNSFTNKKFLDEERVDGLFFKNTMLELLVISLIKIVVFFILNRLFFCLFNYPISRFLRNYSFKIFLVEILIIEDIQQLIFIFIRNFFCFFKIESGAYYLVATIFPLIMAGLILLCFFTLFPLQRYYYGKLSKYFLTNTYRIHGSLALNYILFIIKPIILSSIQALCYDSPKLQLMLLGLT